MNTQHPHQANNIVTQTGKPMRKYRRRHTRVHLNSLKPITLAFSQDTLSHCPKCQGLVFFEAGENLDQTIIRCLNCGWQPHFHAPVIKETEESRTIRSLTNQFVSGSDWDRLPLAW